MAAAVAVASSRSHDMALVVAVADGMGGHAAGEVASQTAVEEALHAIRDAASCRETSFRATGALEAAFPRANAAVYEVGHSSVETRGMGTTLTVAVIYQGHLCTGHVGDSRLYLIRDGTISQITRDHSVVQQKLDAGIITPEEAAVSSERNQLIRVIGTHPSVISDIICTELCEDDALVLCTDGMHNSVTDEDMLSVADSVAAPQEACDALVALAMQRDGSDNITVAYVCKEQRAADTRELPRNKRSVRSARKLTALTLVIVLALAAIVALQLVGRNHSAAGTDGVRGPASDGKGGKHLLPLGVSAPNHARSGASRRDPAAGRLGTRSSKTSGGRLPRPTPEPPKAPAAGARDESAAAEKNGSASRASRQGDAE